MGRFETEVLTDPEHVDALTDLSGKWVDRVWERKPIRELILDLDSSVSETYGSQEGTAEQWIKEGKNAVKWTRLSCHDFVDNQVRLQLFSLAYNLGNFLRRLALPQSVKHWSLTTLREKLVKIGAKVVTHARYVTFQMAEVAIPRRLSRPSYAGFHDSAHCHPCQHDQDRVRKNGNSSRPDGEVCPNSREQR